MIGERTGPGWYLPVAFLGLLLAFGFGLGGAVAGSAYLGLKALAIVSGAVVGLFLLVTRKHWLVLAFFFTVFVVEEFLPALIVAERFDRTITIIYGKSFGIPGLYPVDTMLLGFLLLYLVHALLRREKPPFLTDPILPALLFTMGSIGVSSLLSLYIFPDTTTPEAYQYDEVKIGLKASIAPWVPYFQMKTWVYVYLSYFLTRSLLSDREMIRRFLNVAAFGASAIVGIGAFRLVYYRVIGGQGGALFYDDASLFILILVVCFLMIAWGRRLFAGRHLAWQAILAAASVGVIALSFRRGSWLGAAASFLVTFLLLPRWMKFRVAAAGAIVGLAAVVVMVFAGWGGEVAIPGGGVSEVGRRTSSVYRLALIYNMLRLEQFTLLGFGLKPLWNTPLVMGSFQLNFESVHSLYYWFILRTGVVGLMLLLYLFYKAAKVCWKIRRQPQAPWCAAVAETVLIGLLLFLFLGWFHPIYGMARFVILLGMLFGLLMAVREANEAYLREGDGPEPRAAVAA